MDPQPNGAETVDQDEVARFSRLAGKWWDPRGPMAALHKFNPVRLAYIRDHTAKRFGRDPRSLESLSGLSFLDIGCGAGILGEPLARLGASVVGADPSAENIAVAKAHAARSGLGVDYRATTAEKLAEAGETFDVVLAMEVVEHVTDVGVFIAHAAAMVKPGGLLFVATLNRTARASRSPSSAPNTSCAGCRAAPIDGTSSSRLTNSKPRSSSRAACRRRDRRHLQSSGRSLATLPRHGRQLHGGRGEAGVMPAVGCRNGDAGLTLEFRSK